MRRVSALVVVAVLCVASATAEAQPTWWLTVGGLTGLETGSIGDVIGIEGALLAGTGLNFLRLGPVILGAEVELSVGRATADFGPADDSINIYRGRAGLRGSWWVEHEEPRLVPFARVGAVYRADRGDLIKDEGFGWYVGIGVDFRLSESWTIGPFATYEHASLSVTTKTFLLGFGLTFSY